PTDQIDALTLLEVALEAFGTKALRTIDYEYMISALLREKRHADAEQYLARIEDSPNYHYWYANIINPFSTGNHQNLEPWLAHLNHGMTEGELAPISLRPGDGAPFGRLQAAAPAASVAGPLVTVIMPYYNGGPFADVSIRSILEQT